MRLDYSISTKRFLKKSICNLLLYAHSYLTLLYPDIFLRLYSHIQLALSFFFFTVSFYLNPGAALKYFRHLVILIFCSICLRIQYSYIGKGLVIDKFVFYGPSFNRVCFSKQLLETRK